MLENMKGGQVVTHPFVPPPLPKRIEFFIRSPKLGTPPSPSPLLKGFQAEHL